MMILFTRLGQLKHFNQHEYYFGIWYYLVFRCWEWYLHITLCKCPWGESLENCASTMSQQVKNNLARQWATDRDFSVLHTPDFVFLTYVWMCTCRAHMNVAFNWLVGQHLGKTGFIVVLSGLTFLLLLNNQSYRGILVRMVMHLFWGENYKNLWFHIFFIFSTLICTPCDENSQGQPYKIIKHFFGASLVILVSHHNAGFFTVFSS